MSVDYDAEMYNDDDDDYHEFHKGLVKRRINQASKMAKRKGKFGDKTAKIQRGGVREIQEETDG